MNATWKPSLEQKRKQRRKRFLLLVIFVVLGLTGSFLFNSSPEAKSVNVDVRPQLEKAVSTSSVQPPLKNATQQTDSEHTYQRVIRPGDNLSTIFDAAKIGQPVMAQILSADESLLALDILQPGNKLTFTCDEETQQLLTMELFFHPAHQVVYYRVDDNSFDYEEKILPGTWVNQLIDAEISGSFYGSAMLAGLNEQEVGNITYLFKNKIKFARDMRSGDRFQVVRSLQLVDGKLTGQSHIEGVRIFSRNHSYTAFLFEDGNYYDERGESLARAFQRYPYKGRFRISSAFNPARRHPVTGRISPHKGVDFAMPSGTPIYATGDGEIVRVKNHPYAGKYIEIKHDGRYVTRYLHLSRITVKRGQKIKRGERIALSGNTGRSTGPHLHYELHIKGRAVNPITAKIPMAKSIPKNSVKTFRHQVAELKSLMDQPDNTFIGA